MAFPALGAGSATSCGLGTVTTAAFIRSITASCKVGTVSEVVAIFLNAGSENEWLLSQLAGLHEQTQRLDHETLTLEGHLRQSVAASQTQGPRMVAGGERNPSVSSFQPPGQQPSLQHIQAAEGAFTVRFCAACLCSTQQ